MEQIIGGRTGEVNVEKPVDTVQAGEIVIPQEQWYLRTKDKCCIVGCADTKNIVPFADDSFEFWGVNNLYVTNLPGARYHRWFEIHNIEKKGNIFYRREKPEFRGQTVNAYLEGLAKLPVILYMQKKWDELPNSVPYPIQDVINTLGNYFTNTISYEIALAIMMGFKEIHIYGVDMSVGSEYGHQRPSCEYFIGYAIAKGIPIVIPDEADLLKTRFLYGFGEPKQNAFTKKLKKIHEEVHQRAIGAKNMADQQMAMFHQYQGSLQTLNEMQKIWSNLMDEFK